MHLPITGIVGGSLVFVDQLEAVGGVSGVLFDYTMPTGQAGAYTPTIDDAQVLDSDITESLSADPATTLTADGYLTFGTTFKFLQVSNVGAKTTQVRKYTALIDSGAVSVNAESCIFRFNKEPGANNEWQAKIRWLTATGGFDVQLFERNSGTDTFRDSVTLDVGVDTPALLLLEVFDLGDRVTIFLSGYETDSLADIGAASLTYSAADRPHKGNTAFLFGSWTGTTYSFRSIRVEDF